MSIEMWSIFALATMLLLLTVTQGALTPITQGLRWGLGGRDQPMEKSALQLRFARTVQNHIEGMLIFVPLMALAIYRGIENEQTALAAWMAIGGRAAFIPLYIGGVFALRSLSYGVFVVGVLILILQLV